MDKRTISREDFCDEESRLIFDAKYNFYQTRDYKYIVQLAGRSQKVIDRYNQDMFSPEQAEKIQEKSKWIIFGCGQDGTKMYDCYLKEQTNIVAFCDNMKHGGVYDGKPIFSVEEAAAQKDAGIIISAHSPFGPEMKQQLLGLGFAESDILMLDVNCIYTIKKTEDLDEILMDDQSEFVIYGTEHHEFLLLNLFVAAGIKLNAVCTDHKEPNGTFHGIPLISYDEYMKSYQDCYMICIGGRDYQEMVSKGISRTKLIGMANIDHLQYFDKEIVDRDHEHIFVDGGCLDLATTNTFFVWGGVNAKKSYAFEALKNNCELCIQNGKIWGLKEKVELFHGALWNKEEVLPLVVSQQNVGANLIDENRKTDGNMQNIEMVQGLVLDHVLQGEKVTFIKLDIEGSELNALYGMAETIKKYKPVLAISVYHKPEDIVEIPGYIKSLVPEYRLFLRSYHMDYTEHVLYAVI